MGQLGHEYCVHNGFNRSHAGKYVMCAEKTGGFNLVN